MKKIKVRKIVKTKKQSQRIKKQTNKQTELWKKEKQSLFIIKKSADPLLPMIQTDFYDRNF